MALRFEKIGADDVDRLAVWMPQYHWPYHVVPRVDERWVRERGDAGDLFGPDVASFWIVGDSSSLVGVVRAFELADTTPLLDIRIRDDARGQGLGTEVLLWMTRFVFESYPERHRLGGYTRADNQPMRRVFEKCGFAQEARHRQAWPVEGAAHADTIGYAALRSDWLSRTVTAVTWP